MINAEALLKEVKRVCDEAILANYTQLPNRFVDRQAFDTFRKSAEQKFLSVDTFNAHKRTQESRLKSIEEKLNRQFTFFSIISRIKSFDCTWKASFNFSTIIQYFKNHPPQTFIRILVSLSIAMLALFLFRTIRT